MSRIKIRRRNGIDSVTEKLTEELDNLKDYVKKMHAILEARQTKIIEHEEHLVVLRQEHKKEVEGVRKENRTEDFLKASKKIVELDERIIELEEDIDDLKAQLADANELVKEMEPETLVGTYNFTINVQASRPVKFTTVSVDVNDPRGIPLYTGKVKTSSGSVQFKVQSKNMQESIMFGALHHPLQWVGNPLVSLPSEVPPRKEA